jgi:tricarballylate dehydrogenase
VDFSRQYDFPSSRQRRPLRGHYRAASASVLIVESAPIHFRGGTAAIRATCARCTKVRWTAYRCLSQEEYWQDLLKVTGGLTDETLARLTIRQTERHVPWMKRYGVVLPPLGGTLQLARTNAFFLGGGKALLNAYYAAAGVGVDVAYETEVVDSNCAEDPSPRQR